MTPSPQRPIRAPTVRQHCLYGNQIKETLFVESFESVNRFRFHEELVISYGNP